MSTSRRLALCAFAAATALTAFAAPAAAQNVDRIIAFGDSYADDNNFFQLAGVNPATTGAYTTGRFSGGTNYVDTLSVILGVPVENFAIGGARTGIGNQSNPFSWGFTYEVDQFLGVGTQSAVFPTVSMFDANDLLTVSIGGNDSRAYQLGGGTVAGAGAAAAVSVTDATANLNRLVAAGAPTISFLAGDTGLLPEVAFQPSPATAAAVRTAFSTSFNSGMQATLAGYAAKGVMVHYLDLSLVLGEIQNNLGAFGLTAIACPAFPAPLGPGVPGNTACIANQTGYLVYGDQLHLTSAGFAIVARYVATQLQAPLTLSAVGDLGLDVAHQFGRTLTSRLDTSAPRDGDMPEGLHAFIVGDTLSHGYDADIRTNSFKATTSGITAGADYGFGSGVIGLAGNYSKPKANFRNDAARTETKSFQLGAYAGAGIAGGFVQGYFGLGWNDHDQERRGVVRDLEAQYESTHRLAGIKAGYLMPMGAVRFGPVIALDHARAHIDGYTESGDPALTLNVQDVRAKSLRGSLGGELRGDFSTGGLQVRPFLAATLEKEFNDGGNEIRFSQTSAPTIVNRWSGEDTSRDAYGRLSLGASAGIFEKVSLDVAMSGTVRKEEGNETSAHLGVRMAF